MSMIILLHAWNLPCTGAKPIVAGDPLYTAASDYLKTIGKNLVTWGFGSAGLDEWVSHMEQRELLIGLMPCRPVRMPWSLMTDAGSKLI